MALESGLRQFSRYACSPNELGYCGPDVASAFDEAARGHEVSIDLRHAATQFSGVWIYLTILGKLLNRDPLDPELVRGYWIGNDLVDAVDHDEFWNELIAVIGARAGSYWKHLDESLRAEAAPTHAFHVLGVYPWTRLLATGRPEPVDVLTSCCIRPGIATAIGDGVADVTATTFTWQHGALVLGEESLTAVPIAFGDAIEVGQSVALHWRGICDVLSADEAERLRHDLETQLGFVNARV